VRVRGAPLLVVAVTVASGCGGATLHDQEAVFVQNCGACHAIARGQLSPVPAAPNLYDIHPDAAEIRDAVLHGRPGMPARLVRGSNLDDVVNYVLRETRR
jgi:mono/diheme cytochrome c family protein